MKIDLKTKQTISIPFDESMMNMSYLELPDENYVIALKPNVNSVLKLLEKGGEPVMDPTTKKPIYNVQSNISLQILTLEEHQSMLEATKRKLLR